MASYPKVLFKNEGREGASAKLLATSDLSASILWEGGVTEPTFAGEKIFIENQFFTAAFFDYLIHYKAQQKAAAEDILPLWEETENDPQEKVDLKEAERSYEKKLAHLRKETEQAEETLTKIAVLLAFGVKQDSAVDAYCSACVSRCSHKQLDTPSGWLNAYVCSNCSVITASCSVPRCQHYAIRGLGRTGARNASLPVCAEHTHEIPDFEKANDRLEDLAHWNTLFEYSKTNVKKVAKTSVAVAALASLAIPVFYAAAPGIGAAVGAAKGLHGIAAVNHGLALLGGGPLAAGGMGMAGGQLVVAALGSGFGGAAGLRVATSYLSQDSSFNIEAIRGGEGPAVVFASGFTTEDDRRWAPWKQVIDSRYPNNPVYRVYWGAKELKDLGAFISSGGAVGAGGLKIAAVAAKGAKAAAKNLKGIGLAGNLAVGLAKNPWSTAVNRSKQAGSALASILARTENEHGFILIGHSLGAALMATAASTLGNGEEPTPVVEVHLLGAAYPAVADVEALALGVQQRVYNYHSLNDQVLKNIYKVGALGKTAAGYSGFADEHPRVTNIDVTDVVPGHRKYIDFVKLQVSDE